LKEKTKEGGSFGAQAQSSIMCVEQKEGGRMKQRKPLGKMTGIEKR